MTRDPRPGDHATPPAAPESPGLDVGVVIARLDAGDAEEALEILAARLLADGHVTAAFPAALTERERRWPTGLPTAVPTAIPHAHPEHVIRPCLAIASLARALPFGEMGRAGGTVDVQLVVVPLLMDASAHLAALQRMMALLRDEDAVADLVAAADAAQLRSRAAGYLGGR